MHNTFKIYFISLLQLYEKQRHIIIFYLSINLIKVSQLF